MVVAKHFEGDRLGVDSAEDNTVAVVVVGGIVVAAAVVAVDCFYCRYSKPSGAGRRFVRSAPFFRLFLLRVKVALQGVPEWLRYVQMLVRQGMRLAIYVVRYIQRD